MANITFTDFARVAYGSGISEKKNGGEGFAGILNGKVIKFNTHRKDRLDLHKTDQFSAMQKVCDEMRAGLKQLIQSTFEKSTTVSQDEINEILKELKVPHDASDEKLLLERTVVAKVLNKVAKLRNNHNMKNDFAVWENISNEKLSTGGKETEFLKLRMSEPIPKMLDQFMRESMSKQAFKAMKNLWSKMDHDPFSYEKSILMFADERVEIEEASKKTNDEISIEEKVSKRLEDFKNSTSCSAYVFYNSIRMIEVAVKNGLEKKDPDLYEKIMGSPQFSLQGALKEEDEADDNPVDGKSKEQMIEAPTKKISYDEAKLQVKEAAILKWRNSMPFNCDKYTKAFSQWVTEDMKKASSFDEWFKTIPKPDKLFADWQIKGLIPKKSELDAWMKDMPKLDTPDFNAWMEKMPDPETAFHNQWTEWVTSMPTPSEVDIKAFDEWTKTIPEWIKTF